MDAVSEFFFFLKEEFPEILITQLLLFIQIDWMFNSVKIVNYLNSGLYIILKTK
jgi:hypothetical protein